jgi:HTH-type transcriptional regulator/antitoxin HigA
MEIKPIKTDEDYRVALDEIDRLFDAVPNTPEADRLEVLVTLVETYEQRYFDTSLPDPIEAIKYYMESRGLSRKDLEPFIGSSARVSEILNRKRSLTLRMIRNLEAGLGIPAEVLVQRYDLVTAKEDVTGMGVQMPSALQSEASLAREAQVSLDSESRRDTDDDMFLVSFDSNEWRSHIIDTRALATAPVQ